MKINAGNKRLRNQGTEIAPNIEIHDLALFLKKEKALIIADLHLGYEEMLHSQGVLLPNLNYKDIKDRLKPILEATKPKQIIINGDLKHEFGRISQQEWGEVKGMLNFLKEYTGDIKLVKGNHDNILGPIARHKEVELVESVRIGDVLILHGNKLPDTRRLTPDTRIVLIGHEHPAIGITDGEITEVYKCFIKGTWTPKSASKKPRTPNPQPATLIVQPSFCLITEGTDVLKERLLSPFLKNANLGEFDVWVIGDKPRHFGKIGLLTEKKKS